MLAVGNRYPRNGEDTTGLEDLVRGVVTCRLYIRKLLLLFVFTSRKLSMNPVTNPHFTRVEAG
jgi:hypothetical protein